MSKNKNNYNRNISPANLTEKAATMNEESELKETTPVETTETTNPVETPEAPVETPVAEKQEPAAEEPKKVVPVKKQAAKQPDPAVERLNALLTNYAKLAATPHPTDATRAKFVLAFSDIAEYILGAENYAVFNRFYDFFLKESNAILADDVALAGIHKMTDYRKRERVAAFFSVFFALVRAKRERRRFSLSIRAIRMSLQNDKFCTWLPAKLNGDM